MSVGLVAMGLAIESAIEEKAGEFDLLHGDEAYKRLWARQTRPLRSVELFPSPAMARLYGGAADLSARLRGAVRSALPSRWASRVAAVRRLLREGTD
jgi:CelD/BcsL family acetyltransferase involved in cellulose biosynthesis